MPPKQPTTPKALETQPVGPLCRRGEAAAASYLVGLGYRIVDMNVRPLRGLARGELDIVAWDGDILCFVEVKTRRSPRSRPMEVVTPLKQRQLTHVAQAYLSRYKLTEVPSRFDVVAVILPDGFAPQITLMRDAFTPIY